MHFCVGRAGHEHAFSSGTVNAHLEVIRETVPMSNICNMEVTLPGFTCPVARDCLAQAAFGLLR